MSGTPVPDEDNDISCRWDEVEKRYISLSEDYRRRKMPKLKVTVETEACGEDFVWAHVVDLQEGQSMLDLMYAAVESVTTLYNTEGLKAICLHIEEDT